MEQFDLEQMHGFQLQQYFSKSRDVPPAIKGLNNGEDVLNRISQQNLK